MTKAQLLASAAPAPAPQTQATPQPKAKPRSATRPVTRPRARQQGRGRVPRRARPQPPASDEPPDELVPDPVVWREFGVTSMTLWRWTRDLELGFPPAIKIGNRKNSHNFRSRRALEAFKQRMIARAIAERQLVPQ